MSESQFSGRKAIESALKKLNAKMVYGQIEPVALVCCGGAALNIMGLIARSTNDVDIVAVAEVKKSGKVAIHMGEPLPKRFRELVAEIGVELGIREDWLNFGPSPLRKFGLPPGLQGRLTKRVYGPCLTVFYISRFDQIHFKIYATMDPKAGTRHLADLLDLEPTADESRAAAKWMLSRKTSKPFRSKLAEVLERIGHEQIAEEI